MHMRSNNGQQIPLKADRIELLEGSNVQGHVIQYSDRYHLLIIDGVLVSCTPIEYLLLMLILRRAGGYVPSACLVQHALQSSLNRSTRRTLTQHMSRARAKLWPFGLDLFCITGYGYMLLSTRGEQAEQETDGTPG
jgi:DNA-binding response OmpR family regulator